MGKAVHLRPLHSSPRRAYAQVNRFLWSMAQAEDGIVDPVAIEAIEVGCQRGAQVAVLVDTVSQREFVTSLGFGAQMKGVVSLGKSSVDWVMNSIPGPFQQMPNPFTESAAFKESVRAFSDRIEANRFSHCTASA